MADPIDDSSETKPGLIRDKRGLGLILVSISSIASLAIVGFIVAQIVFSFLDDDLEKEAKDLENFPTAAGSKKPGASPEK